MQKLALSAALAGGLFLTPSAVIAQNVASLPEARSAHYLVFLDKDGLPPTAKQTIRNAAGAVRSGHTVRLSGQARYVEAVKKELLLDGVQPTSIVVRHKSGVVLPTTGDGLSEPQQRRVEIQV
jgi:hypothetical protein